MSPKQVELADAVISHQVALQRYSNGQVRKIIALLNRADADMFAQLVTLLSSVEPSTFQIERLEGLLASVRAINAGAYQRSGELMATDMREFVSYEVGFQFRLFESLSVGFSVTAVSPEQAYAAAMARPFQGALLKDVFNEAAPVKFKRIRDSIRMGFVEGKTISQMVTELRGTKARGYEDGIIEIDRRHAESIVRTAVSHTAGVARDRFHEANADILGSMMWLATLDGRTSEGCIARSGKRYTVKAHKPIGHSIPWGAGPGRLHWGCRSVSLPLLDGQDGFVGEQASEAGPVDANMTYGGWLKRQSAAKQDEVLGKTRGALFRRGGLEIDRFVNDKGKFLSLSDLKDQESKAFEKAGV
jgi:hypothetical protein